MGLESGTYVNDLNTANPDGTDTRSEGDNHIRLIKAVLKNTFPGLAGAVWRKQSKAAGYTVVANDNMSWLDCTAGLTLSWTACATLGNGHFVIVRANGGAVVIDPNGAETVNGAATVTVPNGSTALVLCDGTLLIALILVTTDGAQTLTNKTLSAPVITGAATTDELTVANKIVMSTASVLGAEGANVASANSCNIWSALDGNTVHITGTTTINDFATAPQAGVWMKLVFDGILQLTEGSNLILNNGGSNITTAAGDVAWLYAETTTQSRLFLQRKTGSPVGPSAPKVDIQTFTTAGANTWNKPSGFSSLAIAKLQAWGAGGSGAKGSANQPGGGGGGGGYNERELLLSAMGASETVTIGAGGAAQTSANTAGNAGGNTTIGSLLTAYGGGGGAFNAAGGGGGGGGGTLGAGVSGTTSQVGSWGGAPSVAVIAGGAVDIELQGSGASNAGVTSLNGGPNTFGGGGGGGSGGRGGDSFWGGGGGGGGQDAAGTGVNRGGNSVWGGGGGGGAANSVGAGAGGTSSFGGAGSAGAIDANASSAGAQPGGASGGTEGGDSGKGGDGKVIITVTDGTT